MTDPAAHEAVRSLKARIGALDDNALDLLFRRSPRFAFGDACTIL